MMRLLPKEEDPGKKLLLYSNRRNRLLYRLQQVEAHNQFLPNICSQRHSPRGQRSPIACNVHSFRLLTLSLYTLRRTLSSPPIHSECRLRPLFIVRQNACGILTPRDGRISHAACWSCPSHLRNCHPQFPSPYCRMRKRLLDFLRGGSWKQHVPLLTIRPAALSHPRDIEEPASAGYTPQVPLPLRNIEAAALASTVVASTVVASGTVAKGPTSAGTPQAPLPLRNIQAAALASTVAEAPTSPGYTPQKSCPPIQRDSACRALFHCRMPAPRQCHVCCPMGCIAAKYKLYAKAAWRGKSQTSLLPVGSGQNIGSPSSIKETENFELFLFTKRIRDCLYCSSHSYYPIYEICAVVLINRRCFVEVRY
eukprot:284817765_1